MYLVSKATTDTSTGKFVAPPGTTEALQKYIDLKGAACASATAASAPPGCELVGQAKDMITQLGGTVTVNFATPAAGKKTNKK